MQDFSGKMLTYLIFSLIYF